jgi:hypothetical protein
VGVDVAVAVGEDVTVGDAVGVGVAAGVAVGVSSGPNTVEQPASTTSTATRRVSARFMSLGGHERT